MNGTEHDPNSQGAAPLLTVDGLSVEFPARHGVVEAVRHVSFSLDRGVILGLVGESGSGKSVTARAVMRMVPDPGRIVSGAIQFAGRDLAGFSPREMQAIRGQQIAMVFQDPQAVLNPVKRIGWQIEEALRVHGVPAEAAKQRALELMRLVEIPDPEARLEEYPHQFSGGMRQRVVIAIALANEPSLLIADEPTTALDVTIQAQVLKLLVDLRDRLGVAVMMITHDMGVVAEMCDHIAVMYAGTIVETGSVREVMSSPAHNYTASLLRSIPRVDGSRRGRLESIAGTPPDPANLPQGCKFADRCSAVEDVCRPTEPTLQALARDPQHMTACVVGLRDGPFTSTITIRATERAERPTVAEPILEIENLVVDVNATGRPRFGRHEPLYAVNGVSLQIRPGETLGLVGESGSGKSSLARTIVGINRPTSGVIRVDGTDVTAYDRDALQVVRSNIQYVFQDPYASLNPRRTIRETLEEALGQRTGIDRAEIPSLSRELIERVGLRSRHLDLQPRSFSGGQRQRIGIARALAVQPRLLLCDEPVSALDVSVQAQIINLLADLRDELDVALLFIAHDLSVVRQLSDRVAVMYMGRFAETGDVETLYTRPRHPYTSVLLASTPSTDTEGSHAAIDLFGEIPSIKDPPSGCRFRTRCPVGPLADPSRTQCVDDVPQLHDTDGRQVACHYPVDVLHAERS
jgi:peptide/nickel transport system ATP-binding protein